MWRQPYVWEIMATKPVQSWAFLTVSEYRTCQKSKWVWSFWIDSGHVIRKVLGTNSWFPKPKNRVWLSQMQPFQTVSWRQKWICFSPDKNKKEKHRFLSISQCILWVQNSALAKRHKPNFFCKSRFRCTVGTDGRTMDFYGHSDLARMYGKGCKEVNGWSRPASSWKFYLSSPKFLSEPYPNLIFK